jgi:aldehyde dehydrogenase (NAD+)
MSKIERCDLYINGAWVSPAPGRALELINPSTEELITCIALGGPADLELAVAAARRAFDS